MQLPFLKCWQSKCHVSFFKASFCLLCRFICSVKAFSLIVLVLQNSLVVLMTRFSRQQVPAAENYHPSSLVLSQEILKLIMCWIIYAFEHRSCSRKPLRNELQILAVQEAESAVSGESSSDSERKSGDHATSSMLHPLALLLPSVSGRGVVDEEVKEKMLGKVGGAAGSPTGTQVHVNSHEGILGGQQLNITRGWWNVGEGCRPTSSPSEKKTDVSRSGTPCHSSETSPWEAKDTMPSLFVKEMAERRKEHGSSPFPEDTCSVAVHRGATGSADKTSYICLPFCSHFFTPSTKQSSLKNFFKRGSVLDMFVPAVLFNLQNFLVFFSLSNLDAVSYQMWSQLKLLCTALLSVQLLGRRLSLAQWLSLGVLTCGIVGAQIGSQATTTTKSPTPSSSLLPVHIGHPVAGIASCVVSSLSSSYASVYFEKVVKVTHLSLSERNIQLSIFAVPLAFFSMMVLDVVPQWLAQRRCGEPIHFNIFRHPPAAVAPQRSLKGLASLPFDPLGTVSDEAAERAAVAGCGVTPFYFWRRYDQPLTWCLIALHALGGLLVAVVMRYADNIAKCFATGSAVVLSGVVSSVIWEYRPTVYFVVAAFLVIASSISFHHFALKH